MNLWLLAAPKLAMTPAAKRTIVLSGISKQMALLLQLGAVAGWGSAKALTTSTLLVG